jgi:ppGpp synthetase/RelA/SpoT-type nucleotidyltranferase
MQSSENSCFSKSQIDKAGQIIKNSKNKTNEYKNSIKIIKKWREYHSDSLKSTRYHIDYEGKKIDKKSLTIQRLKRIISIESKLKNSTTRLSKMQDIGGCRIIVSDINKLQKLYENIQNATPANKLITNIVDYIKSPNSKTGYRGIHIIYQCLAQYQIEVQLRTKLQHSWATAVEIAGTFLRQNIKSGKIDSEYLEWLEFFRLSSIVFANEEKKKNIASVLVENNLDDIKKKLIAIEQNLNAFSKLNSYSVSTKEINRNRQNHEKHEHFVINLNELTGQGNITFFKKNQELEAEKEYSRLEIKHTTNSSINIVLVSAKSINDIKIGFPNYFADSSFFINNLKNILCY